MERMLSEGTLGLVLGIERMMHGVETIFDYLTNDDKSCLGRLF